MSRLLSRQFLLLLPGVLPLLAAAGQTDWSGADMQAQLKDALVGVDRLLVTANNRYLDDLEPNIVLFELRGEQAIASLADVVKIDDVSPMPCLCYGTHTLHFYRGGDWAFSFAYKHHQFLKGNADGPWESQAKLAPESAVAFRAWFAKRGFPLFEESHLYETGREAAGKESPELAERRKKIAGEYASFIKRNQLLPESAPPVFPDQDAAIAASGAALGRGDYKAARLAFLGVEKLREESPPSRGTSQAQEFLGVEKLREKSPDILYQSIKSSLYLGRYQEASRWLQDIELSHLNGSESISHYLTQHGIYLMARKEWRRAGEHFDAARLFGFDANRALLGFLAWKSAGDMERALRSDDVHAGPVVVDNAPLHFLEGTISEEEALRPDPNKYFYCDTPEYACQIRFVLSEVARINGDTAAQARHLEEALATRQYGNDFYILAAIRHRDLRRWTARAARPE